MSISKSTLAALSCLTPSSPVSIDDLLKTNTGNEGTNLSLVENAPMVSSQLWKSAEQAPTYVGIRVKAPISEPLTLASNLAAVALERDISPVFVSWIGDCGLQRFGFRVEFVGGGSDEERTLFEEQLARLWKFAIIIDAADISNFS